MDAISILRLPPVLSVVALAAQRLVSRNARSSASTTVAGAGLAVAGAAIEVAGVREFRSAGTTLDPLHPGGASGLVTRGIFRHSRNPIYLGGALMLLGYAVHRRSPAALLPAAGWVAVIDGLQIPAEEEALFERFGARYGDYSAVVRRWL